MAEESLERVFLLSLNGGADDDLAVTSLDGEETLHGFFHFWIEVVALHAGQRPALGDQATVTIRHAGQSGSGRHTLIARSIDALVVSVAQLPMNHDDPSKPHPAFRLLLAPAHWPMTLNRRFRNAGSEQSLSDLVAAIVQDHGQQSDCAASDGADTVFPHRFQYGESDWHFLKRQLEEIGFAHHVDDTGTLICAPVAGSSASEETLTFMGSDEHDIRFSWAHPAVINRLVPLWSVLSAKARALHWDAAACADAVDEQTIAQNLAPWSSQDSPTPGEPLDHQESFPGDATFVTRTATAAALAHRGAAGHYDGSGDARSLRAGWTFTLEHHPDSELNQTYRVIRVHHRARQDFSPGLGAVVNALYRNDFTCVVADQPWAPPQETPRPRPPSLLTAEVTNDKDPDGEGRYQVGLCLTSDPDSRETCWIPVLHAFAGDGYGVNLPIEVGTQVAVGFLADDIDRPVIVGVLHDAKRPVPAELAVSEEDTAEKLQEDPRIDHVGLITRQGQSLYFHEADDATFVSLRATGKEELLLDTAGKRVHLTDGERKQYLTLDAEGTTVTLCSDSGEVAITSKETQSQTAKDHTLTASGDQTIAVSGDADHSYSKKLDVSVGGKHTLAADGGIDMDGSASLKAKATKCEITGDSKIVLTVGGCSIEVTTSGITINGTPSVTVKGAAQATVEGAAQATVKGGMVTVEGTGMVDVKGPMVTVNGSGMLGLKGGMIAIG